MVQRRHILQCAPVTLVTVFLYESYKISSLNVHCARKIVYTTIPHPTSVQTLLHHTRSISIDHVTIPPHDEDGYVGLLLVVEHDTKYPVAYPVRDYFATTVATVLFKRFCTFGSFDFIYSDPGSSLMSNVVSDLNTWLGIPHRVSLIGRHESNGTEHVNALLLGHLRRLVLVERLIHRWASDTVLPLINHALSTAPAWWSVPG